MYHSILFSLVFTVKASLLEDVSTLPQIECHNQPTVECLKPGETRSCEGPNFYSTTCTTTTNITLNQTHPNFRFKDKPMDLQVGVVKFHNLIMHTFTNDTCLEFLSIVYIKATGIGLQVLLPNALEPCIDLTNVNFGNKQLLRISSGTFRQNPKLKKIEMANNRIGTFEANAFDNLGNLEYLDIKKHQLKQFPSDGQLVQLPQLTELVLSSDTLEQIDIEEILSKCPSLEFVALCENSFMSKQYIKEKFKIPAEQDPDYDDSYLQRESDYCYLSTKYLMKN